MLLTQDYTRVVSALSLEKKTHDRNLYGWITPDNKYLDIYDHGGSHSDVLKKFGISTVIGDDYVGYREAISQGWVRVIQPSRDLHCELLYSRVRDTINILQGMITPWVNRVYFYMYDNNGKFTGERELDVIDGVIQ